MTATARRRGALLIVWIALIFSSTPYTGELGKALLATPIGAWVFGEGSLLVVGALAVLIARQLHRRGVRLSVWGLLASATIGYAAALRWLALRPIERIHLPEYGLVAILAWWTLIGADLGRRPAYLGALAVTAAIGLFDEAIQYVIPTRYFDWRDVLLNAVAGLLALTMLAAARRVPPGDRRGA